MLQALDVLTSKNLALYDLKVCLRNSNSFSVFPALWAISWCKEFLGVNVGVAWCSEGVEIPGGRNSLYREMCMRAKLLQLCPTFCDPMDCSPPGSSVRGILQARILEWVVMPFSRGSSQPRDQTCVSNVSCICGWVGTSLVAQTVKRLPTMQETRVRSLGWKDLLEKEMETHSSTLAWKIPWTEEPGRLQSMGSQRVGHDWATSMSMSISWLLAPPGKSIPQDMIPAKLSPPSFPSPLDCYDYTFFKGKINLGLEKLILCWLDVPGQSWQSSENKELVILIEETNRLIRERFRSWYPSVKGRGGGRKV